MWGKGYGGHSEKTGNVLLGIQGMSDAEIQMLVNRLAR